MLPELFAFRIGGAVAQPSGGPTAEPTAEPTSEATAEPTSEATTEPTEAATAEPTTEATSEPTAESTAAATTEATAATGTTVDLSAVDLAFQPKDFTIPANTDVTIDVSNDGAVVHDFFQPDTKADTGNIEPGKKGTAVVSRRPAPTSTGAASPATRTRA